jgi:hypothetical protein
MALELNGTTGVSLVQDGVVTAADLASGAITSAALPAGSVLQVVQGSTTGNVFSTSSATFVKDTSVNVAITPTSATSKILVVASLSLRPGTYTRYIFGTLIRTVGGSDTEVTGSVGSGNTYGGLNFMYDTGTSATQGVMMLQYLDSPATTSEITYSPAYRRGTDSHTLTRGGGSLVQTITAMEIAG